MAIIQAEVNKLDLSMVGKDGALSSPYKLSSILDKEFQPVFTEGEFGPYVSITLTQKGIEHSGFASAPKGIDLDEVKTFTLVAGIAPEAKSFKIGDNPKPVSIRKGQIKFFLKPDGFKLAK